MHQCICLTCKKSFTGRSHKSKYCSNYCKGRSRETDPDPVLKLWDTGISAYEISQRLKLGYHTVERIVKIAGRWERRYIRKANPIKRTLNAHAYRDKAFAHYGAKCSVCGYDKYERVLQVNHRNGNPHDNSLENLQVLCPTCHVEYHLLNQSGWFAPKRTGAT